MIITRHWLRFWRNGPGIAWKPARAKMLFSQRLGFTRTVVILGVRFSWIRGGR